ncbi:MAG: hypothetical protein MJ175_10540, partial [Clostridia bacterium]|nr:hypothetical protein [Clostridia bacterium]
MQNQKSGEQTGRIFQRLHRFKSQLHRGAVPDALSDNHYILAVMCDRVLICEKDRTLRRELADTALQRRVLGAVSDLDPAMDETQIIKALSLHDPDDCFLRVLLPVWGAELLRGIADAARRKGVPDDFDIRIAWLHRLRTMDFDALRDALSPVEALLRKDPLGTYPRCSDETKAAYREAVRRRAEACGEDEETVLNEILDSLKEQNTSMDLSDVLFEKPRNRGLLFHAVVLAAAFLCSALTGVFLRRFGFLRAVIPAIFVFLPFYALFREAGSILIGRVMRPMETLSLGLDTVPGEGCTLTVITTLLSGEERDRAIFDNLERFWLRNCPRGETGSEHLYFGVLGDLPEAQHAEAPGDGAILRYAAARIDALNRKYGDHFGLWIRSRRYAPTEHCFMGWERKRGAVLELARRLRGVEMGFAVAKEPAGIGRTVYLCTLDGDTELPPGALVTMVSAMLHPANKPVIENGRVVRGIGMLQPRMAVSLAGAAATRFTLLCTGKGGADPYSRFSADGEQMLYGEGSFCGKGLFNVDAYLAVLDGAFPEGCVLSHDFLEGQRLGCRNFSSVTLTDRIPTGVVSYFERQARWVRGDTQALRFAFSTVKNAAGEKIPNPVPRTGRLRVWDHRLYALIP